jgi:hypothetical protein
MSGVYQKHTNFIMMTLSTLILFANCKIVDHHNDEIPSILNKSKKLMQTIGLIVLFIFLFADFEDMSCEMIFGQDPPASMDDPSLNQPCYKKCEYFIAKLLTFTYMPNFILVRKLSDTMI